MPLCTVSQGNTIQSTFPVLVTGIGREGEVNKLHKTNTTNNMNLHMLSYNVTLSGPYCRTVFKIYGLKSIFSHFPVSPSSKVLRQYINICHNYLVQISLQIITPNNSHFWWHTALTVVRTKSVDSLWQWSLVSSSRLSTSCKCRPWCLPCMPEYVFEQVHKTAKSN
jgi:hypothetical protein